MHEWSGFAFVLHSDQETSSETTAHPQTAAGTLVDVRRRVEEVKEWAVWVGKVG